MLVYFILTTLFALTLRVVASYDFFFLYADRDHNGKIDSNDIERIRNPAWHREWTSFDISEFLPINKRDFNLFIHGMKLCKLT